MRVMQSQMAASISSEMFACKAEALAISFSTITKGKGENYSTFSAWLPSCLCNPSLSALKGVKGQRKMNQPTKTQGTRKQVYLLKR